MTESNSPIPTRSSARWILLAIALVCVLPLMAALYFRFVSPPEVPALVGQALTPVTFPFAGVQRMNGQPMAHPAVSEQWLVVHAGSGLCDPICRDALYLTRQARTAQGRNMERIQRVWIITDATMPAADLLALHPDLLLLRATDRRAIGPFEAGAAIHLVDPRGYVVFSYSAASDPKAFIRELGKLVRF